MNAALVAFVAFVVLSTFNAGAMTTLQIQHYGIYGSVGRDGFADYMKANNAAALVPVILPALSLLAVTAFLVVDRPPFMTTGEATIAFALNVAQLASTVRWQRRLQGEMAQAGFDATKVRLLTTTNWIRTWAFLLQAFMASAMVLRVTIRR
ncbi:MAG: hypothetical protein ABI910_03535 [Gemmatimonadota bacterium]